MCGQNFHRKSEIAWKRNLNTELHSQMQLLSNCPFLVGYARDEWSEACLLLQMAFWISSCRKISSYFRDVKFTGAVSSSSCWPESLSYEPASHSPCISANQRMCAALTWFSRTDMLRCQGHVFVAEAHLWSFNWHDCILKFLDSIIGNYLQCLHRNVLS